MTGTVALLRDVVICLPCLVTSVGEVAAVHGYTVTQYTHIIDENLAGVGSDRVHFLHFVWHDVSL